MDGLGRRSIITRVLINGEAGWVTVVSLRTEEEATGQGTETMPSPLRSRMNHPWGQLHLSLPRLMLGF